MPSRAGKGAALLSVGLRTGVGKLDQIDQDLNGFSLLDGDLVFVQFVFFFHGDDFDFNRFVFSGFSGLVLGVGFVGLLVPLVPLFLLLMSPPAGRAPFSASAAIAPFSLVTSSAGLLPIGIASVDECGLLPDFGMSSTHIQPTGPWLRSSTQPLRYSGSSTMSVRSGIAHTSERSLAMPARGSSHDESHACTKSSELCGTAASIRGSSTSSRRR